MHKTNYVIVFVTVMTVLVALILSLMSTGLKDIHDKNESVYNKRAIISAVKNKLDKKLEEMSDEEVADIFSNQIKQLVVNSEGKVLSTEEVIALGYPGGTAENVDMSGEKKKPEENRIYPLFLFEKDGKTSYITSVIGNGLWDEIWGNIALDDDLETISGVAFDHRAETPGLGAEIKDNDGFKKQFIGKKILNADGEFVGISLIKGGAKDDDPHAVDGITGATVTANGVEEMIKRGMKSYLPYFKK